MRAPRQARGNIDDWLQDVIDNVIREGKLFDLLFSETGRQIWEGYPEKKIKKMVKKSFKERKVTSTRDREHRSEYDRAYAARHKVLGLCSRCPQPVVEGSIYCLKHWYKGVAKDKRFYQRHKIKMIANARATKKRLTEEGRCQSCGQPITDNSARCMSCKELQKIPAWTRR